MARLYDWEAFLTTEERLDMAALDRDLRGAKDEARAIQFDRDEIRRKAVQRARNALNKKARAALEKQS